MQRDASCNFPGDAAIQYMDYAVNNSTKKNVYVTLLETVHHLNAQPPKSDDQYKNIFYVQKGGTPAKSLGCAQTKALEPDAIDQFSFTKLAACFEGECPSEPDVEPSSVRDPQKPASSYVQMGTSAA